MAEHDRPDDQTLIDYLLSIFPSEETQRLDELSIVDDGFAGRLSEAENALIDAYVAGGLTSETRRRVEARYQSSATGRRQIKFAEALRKRMASYSPLPAAQKAVEPFIFSFVLAPSLRGTAPVAKMVIPRGTDLIRWTLTEVDEFPSYEVAIRNAASAQVIWREGALHAGTGDAARSIVVTIRAGALEAGAYVVELAGVSRDAAATMINGYPVRVLFE